MIALCLVLTFSLFQDEKPQPEEKLTWTVQKGTLTLSLHLEGTFEPGEAHEVRFEPSAYRGELKVVKAAPFGHAVKKGDLLIELEAPDLADVMAGAEADLAAARADRKHAEEDFSYWGRATAENIEELTRRKEHAEEHLLHYNEVEAPMRKAESELGLKRHQDRVDDQTEELEQLEKMYKSEELTNATSEIVVNRARRALVRMKEEQQYAQKRSDRFISHELVETRERLQKERDQAAFEWEKASRLSELERLKKEASLAQKRLEEKEKEKRANELRGDHDALLLKAPMDGILFPGSYSRGAWSKEETSRRKLRPGEEIKPEDVAVTVTGSVTRVRVLLPEPDIHRYPTSQKARVTSLAFPDLSFSATPEAVTIQIVEQKNEVWLTLEKGNENLSPGMKAKVNVEQEKLKDMLIIPTSAVAHEDGKSWVYLVHEGEISTREVEVGKRGGKQVQILKGLEVGDKVLVTGLPKP